jgi:DnaK suppressor protein
MKTSEVNKFREVLEATVIELDRSARRREGIVVERTADEIDRLLLATERELAVQKLEAVSTKLREARAALRRIEDGTYGICLECDESISASRLRAMPSAALCIRCQETSDSSNTTRYSWPSYAMAA